MGENIEQWNNEVFQLLIVSVKELIKLDVCVCVCLSVCMCVCVGWVCM